MARAVRGEKTSAENLEFARGAIRQGPIPAAAARPRHPSSLRPNAAEVSRRATIRLVAQRHECRWRWARLSIIIAGEALWRRPRAGGRRAPGWASGLARDAAACTHCPRPVQCRDAPAARPRADARDSLDLQLPTTAVPMFPLPGAFLFPHQLLPLHVFEARYRRLVADLLDGPGRLVIGTIREGERETAEHRPEVLPVAGFGEIVRHEKLPDGRYLIGVLGLARVHIAEVASDRPYRLVVCTPFVEVQATDLEAEELGQRLRNATSAQLQRELPLPDSTPPGMLADLLVQTLGAPQRIVERVFAEPSVSTRARLALAAAARTPPPREREA
jgi:Lon protease-like protein